MQAIITKYHAPTNIRGARYTAKCERGSISVSYDYALSADGNHIAARQALIAKFVKEDAARYPDATSNPWSSPMVYGTLPGGEGVHVFMDK